ncbi:MAG: DUF3467 domain-containing protein [Chloroflexi bacterium]|nr:DUF3467 domain-containing protein [Chloroflexota bacterium]
MTTNPEQPAAPSFPPLDMPEDLVPAYANLVRISHSPAELVFDFAQMLPGNPRARIQSRLLMSPIGAKLFYRALGENLARYEAAFGEIKIPGDSSLANDLFRSLHRPDNPG